MSGKEIYKVIAHEEYRDLGSWLGQFRGKYLTNGSDKNLLKVVDVCPSLLKIRVEDDGGYVGEISAEYIMYTGAVIFYESRRE